VRGAGDDRELSIRKDSVQRDRVFKTVRRRFAVEAREELRRTLIRRS
jgi:hypothetical protein